MDILLNYLHSGFTHAFSFVILLGVLVFVHELGHFLVAVWCGVKVEVFSLGFGKKIFQYQKGDTNYCISLIPLGGYVKMFGEQPGDEIPEDQKKVSFTHKKVSQRLAIVLAGPIMNLFFAFLVFIVVAFSGETFKAPFIGEVNPGSQAEIAGFSSGDKILKVDNTAISTWDQFQDILDSNIEKNLKITLQKETSKEEKVIETRINSKVNPNVVTLKKHIGEISGLTPLSYAPVVAINKKSSLYQLGLRYGDRIDSINGVKILNFRDINPYLTKWREESLKRNDIEPKLVFKVVRNEIDKKNTSQHTFELILKSQDLISGNSTNAAQPSIFTMENLGLESTQLYVDRVMPDSPAEKAGIKRGDKIISINNKSLNIWDDILTNVKSFSEKDNTLSVGILRDEEQLKLQITPQMTTHDTLHGTEEKRYTIGISPLLMYAQPEVVVISEKSFSAMIQRSFVKTWDVSVMTILSFVRLIQNQISPKNIGGIFSIAQAANETFKLGLSAFLQMMGLISINLFILNLLPIPMLDGGHIVFYCIEAIKGSPLSLNKMEIAHKVGMILLFSLMIFALFNDFKRMFGFM
ncbi:MAG: RIP metalloprotease RseP [Bdellovibrionaceae bacterium]|nr:RIP metalloprotease RseP [Pseudobdellovibrionaceae bacterium]